MKKREAGEGTTDYTVDARIYGSCLADVTKYYKW